MLARPQEEAEQVRLPDSILRVLIADDSPSVRLALRVLLQTQVDIQVVGEAVDGVDAVRAREALAAGAVGYILKSNASKQLISALRGIQGAE